MRYLSALLVIAIVACGDDSTGLSTSGTNFSVTNRSTDSATVVLHQYDFLDTDADSVADTWVARAETAFALTVQPGVCTDVSLNLQYVAGTVTTPSSTTEITPFWLSDENTWTVTVLVNPGPDVKRSSRLRGAGCSP